jgi:hypothetical protein
LFELDNPSRWIVRGACDLPQTTVLKKSIRLSE